MQDAAFVDGPDAGAKLTSEVNDGAGLITHGVDRVGEAH